MADRTERIAALLEEIDAGEVDPVAMKERFGMSARDARRVVVASRARARMRRAPPRPRSVSRGVWMRADVVCVFDELAESEGGRGIALATALHLLRAVRAAQGSDFSRVVEVRIATPTHAEVTPALDRAV